MDNSWDNSGTSKPKRNWKYGNALVSASIIAFSLLAFCTVWILWFSRNQTKIAEIERNRAKPDWAAATLIVEAMMSDAGAKALYQANPKLSTRFKSESAFLLFTYQWRSQLEPLPKDVPRPDEKNFGHRHGFGLGPTILSYKMPRGCWITIHWSGPLENPSRQLTDIECYQ